MNKNTIIAVLVLTLGIFSLPQKSYATVPAFCGGTVTSSCDATGVVQSAVKALDKAVGKAIDKASDAFDKLDEKVNDKIDDVEDAIKEAANGLSQTVTSSGVNIAKNRQKIEDVVLTKKLEQKRRLQEGKRASEAQPTAKDCLILTDKRNKPSEEAINKATADLVNELRLQRRKNLNKVGKIARGAANFQRLQQFCDPNMPNAPDACAETALTNADKNHNLLLGEVTIEDPVPLEVLMDSINPVTGDVQPLPSYSTASGQRRWLSNEAKMVRQNFIDAVLAQMAADRMPTSNTGDEQLSMWRRILGSNAPAALINYYEQTQTAQVSEASKREIERLSFIAYQNSLDSSGLSKSGASREIIYDLAKTVEMEYKGYLADERKNILLALRYAGMVKN